MKSYATYAALALMAGMLAAPAYAQEMSKPDAGMSIMLSSQGSMLVVEGITAKTNDDIALRITGPNGNVVGIDQVRPDSNGVYTASFTVGQTWKSDGEYTVLANQGGGNYQVTAKVEISAGNIVRAYAFESTIVEDTQKSNIVTSPIDAQGQLVLTDGSEEGTSTIIVSGTTDKISEDITLRITSPNGNFIHLDQIRPDRDGSFVTMVEIGPGNNWEQDGFYTVLVSQGDSSFYNAEVMVDVKDRVIVPEFGTVAILVLTVAIVSIVALTARSRLSMSSGL